MMCSLLAETKEAARAKLLEAEDAGEGRFRALESPFIDDLYFIESSSVLSFV
jgi:hypothetical protein